MATYQDPVMGGLSFLESGIFPDQINNQVAFTNESGNLQCIVLPAASEIAADTGMFITVPVSADFSSATNKGSVIVRGFLDGALSSNTIAMGVKGDTGADDAAGDAAYSTQDLGTLAGTHADKDRFELSISLSNLTPVADQDMNIYLFVDDSAHTYTGHALVTSILFEWSDA